MNPVSCLWNPFLISTILFSLEQWFNGSFKKQQGMAMRGEADMVTRAVGGRRRKGPLQWVVPNGGKGFVQLHQDKRKPVGLVVPSREGVHGSHDKDPTFKEVLLKDMRWPEVPLPLVGRCGDILAIVFRRKELEHRLTKMESSLVGWVVGLISSINALRAWKVSGDLKLQRLPRGLLLFKFPSKLEARRVLREEVWRWEGGGVLLDVWHPSVGCCWRNDEGNHDRWIWIHGLPVHLWGKAIYEKIGDLCGGLKEVEPMQSNSWEWLKLKVFRPEKALESLWVINGMLGYWVAIWRRKLPSIIPMNEARVNTGKSNTGRSVGQRRESRIDSNFESMGSGRVRGKKGK